MFGWWPRFLFPNRPHPRSPISRCVSFVNLNIIQMILHACDHVRLVRKTRRCRFWRHKYSMQVSGVLSPQRVLGIHPAFSCKPGLYGTRFELERGKNRAKCNSRLVRSSFILRCTLSLLWDDRVSVDLNIS